MINFTMKVYVMSLLLVNLYRNFSFAAASFHPNDVRNYLGTRTPYRFKYNKDDSKIKYPHCKDAKVWMLIRHGTRQPSPDDILGINNTLVDLKFEILLHNKLKGQLNKEQIRAFEEWSTNIDIEEQKFLTHEGEDEMALLAARTKKRFPNAIRKKYNSDNFLFRYTDTQRAQQSARAFANGLFGNQSAQDIVFTPAAKVDPVLRFYKHCDKWQKQVKKNPDTYKEQKIFGASREMALTLESVSKRLGLSRVLSLDEVNLMYKVCGYETSWSKHYRSPWCYAFNRTDAENLEYYHDLKHYWLDGYGHNLTYQQACLSLNHMFHTFKHEESPNATFLFAHSGTLLKLLSHLQLYKPKTPLTGDTVQKQRPWRVSDIDCFASNLAFVLFKCRHDNFILTLHQERIIRLPMCEEELCSLEHFEEYFHDSLHKCDFSNMCRLKDEL